MTWSLLFKKFNYTEKKIGQHVSHSGWKTTLELHGQWLYKIIPR